MILLVNDILQKQGFDIYVGLNPVTLLTSGTLGFPGVALLYGIEVTKFLQETAKVRLFSQLLQTSENAVAIMRLTTKRGDELGRLQI